MKPLLISLKKKAELRANISKKVDQLSSKFGVVRREWTNLEMKTEDVLLNSLDVCLEKQLFRDKIGRKVEFKNLLPSDIKPEEVVKMIRDRQIHPKLHMLQKSDESIIK